MQASDRKSLKPEDGRELRWLVVVGGKPAADRIPEMLRAAAARVADGAEWIRLSDDEWTIEVDGPDDLPARLAGADGVTDVYPSSEMSYY